MKSRLVVAVALALALASVSGTVSRVLGSTYVKPPAAHATLPHVQASYLGAFEPGAPPSYAPVQSFTKVAGREPNLIGYYSGWAEPFNMTFASMLRRHGIIPYVQIDPTDASVAAIAHGSYDQYLRSYADSVRNFNDAVVIGFGHEMNANWYSWGYQHVPPATFIAAWQHLVRVFREQGADNVTWLWTLQADGPRTGRVANWWPGSRYVTWVGVDGYYNRPADTFATVFGTTIDQVKQFTNDPVLLSETAVGPDAGQFAKIQDLFSGMSTYGTLGLVWFDKAQSGSMNKQDWRLEDNTLAEQSFELGVKNELAPVTPTG
ncbi:MAG TPA: glycosyl hydrolase [Streptosporangiaceae bacterium]